MSQLKLYRKGNTARTSALKQRERERERLHSHLSWI